MTQPLARRFRKAGRRAARKALAPNRIGPADILGEIILSPAAQGLAADVAETDYGLLVDAAVDYAIAKYSVKALTKSYIERMNAVIAEIQLQADKVVLGTLSDVFTRRSTRQAVSAVAEASRVLGQTVTAGQLAAGSLTSAAMSAKLDAAPIPPDLSITERDGVTKEQEYARPFRVAERALDEGATREEAAEQALKRSRSLVAVDIQMAKLRQSQIVMTENGVLFYRRVPTSPDPCELCLITSSNVYATNELMPIHTHCACNVEPIDIDKIDGPPTQENVQYQLDSRAALPTADGDQKKLIGSLLEEDAPVSSFRDLVATRVHGEVGPWLTWRHQDAGYVDAQRFSPVGLESSRVPPEYQYLVSRLNLTISGNPVAKPTNRGNFDDLADQIWEANFFDKIKGPARDAVRQVQQEGYKGLAAEAKSLGLTKVTTAPFYRKHRDSFLMFGMGYQAAKYKSKPFDMWNRLTDEERSIVNLAGKEIAARAFASKPTTMKLYRGLRLKDEEIDDLVPGDELSLPASSFVDKRVPAIDGFAAGPQGSNFWMSADADKPGVKPVLIEVRAGARAAKINYTVPAEPNEFVSFGRFEIVSINKRKFGPLGGLGYTHIVVEHKSLIESDKVEFTGSPFTKRKVAASETSSATTEYTVIKKDEVSGLDWRNRFVQSRNGNRSGLDWRKVHPGEIADYGSPLRIAVQLEARHPKINVDIDTGSIKSSAVFLDVARQLDSLMVKYPQANIRRLSAVKVLGERRYAEADIWQEGLALDRDFTATEVRLNPSPEKFGGDGAKMEEQYNEDIASGFHPPIADYSAAEATMTHEFAHVLDATGGYQASQEASKVLKAKFIELNPEWAKQPPMPSDYVRTIIGVAGSQRAWETRWTLDRNAAYNEWLKTQLSGYSFNRDGGLNPTEAIAEAFAHVELSPSTANDAERALHKIVVDYAKKRKDFNLNAPGWRDAASEQSPAKVVAEKEKTRGASVRDRQRGEDKRATESRNARGIPKVGRSRRGSGTSKSVTQRAAAELASLQIEARKLMNSSRKTSGFARPKGEDKFESVTSRIKEGKSVEPIFYVKKDGKVRMSMQNVDYEVEVNGKIKTKTDKMLLPVIDQQATWDSITDEMLETNWRAALKASESWARESGMIWYGELRELCTNLAAAFNDSFKGRYDIELTPDIVAGIISSYSTNNGWAGNIVGAVKFMSDTFDKGLGEDGGGKIGFFKPGSIDPRAMHFQNEKWGVKPMLKFIQKGGTVEEYFASNPDAPKPYNFLMSIRGKPDAVTVDRWIARIMLHTNDYWLADKLWASSSKKGGRYGFERMRRIIQKVAAEDGMSAFMAQAIPWIHVNGPRGAIAKLEVAALFEAVTSATPNKAVEALFLQEAQRRGWVDDVGRPIDRNPAA